MESYLGIGADGATQPIPATDSSDDGTGSETELYLMDEQSVTFEPFRDLCKRRFLWYYDSYLQSINKARTEVKDDVPFARMPFEGNGNTMEGKFHYTELERRLRFIKSQLDLETLNWASDGLSAKRRDTGLAANLQRQYEQVVEQYKKDPNVTLDIGLIGGNPFVWEVTYFGRPMTNLDGGLFKIMIHLSPRFPDEQPRIKFETKLFHHRIAADGTPCYFPKKPDCIKSHIEALIDALEEESPPYDPRTLVNPEASKLYWGSKDDKKVYNRQLRRAVQRTTE
jgi:ubiquitin-conjugating enzyme E2 Z